MSDAWISDQFREWRALLRGEKPVIAPDEPIAGYFRVRRGKGAPWEPMAVWRENGELHARVSDDTVDPLTYWPFYTKNPIEYAVYIGIVSGEPWPDENHAVVGHNLAPPDDSAEAISERIDELVREAERFIAAGPASEKAIADQASDVANTLSELAKKADDLREEEKAPHLLAGRMIDGKWMPLMKRANEIKVRLRAIVVAPFLDKDEAERKAAAIAAIAAGVPPERAPNPKAAVGSAKRTTSLRTRKSAEVTDWSALLAALVDHPDVREAAQKVADASARAGVALPGTTIKTERVAV